MYSVHLRRLARLTLRNPVNGFALLPRAIDEGALRVLNDAPVTATCGTSDYPLNVPRQIVQYWHSRDRPADVEQAIRKVRECNPDSGLTVFDEADGRAFIGAHFEQSLGSIFDLCFHHAMKSDLFRLCYLYVHGGVYLDVDVACSAPIETIFPGPFFRCFLLYEEGRPWCIDNGLIAVEPANDLIAAMLLNLERNLIAYKEGRRFRDVWAETGPGVATETITCAVAHQIATGSKATMLGWAAAGAQRPCPSELYSLGNGLQAET